MKKILYFIIFLSSVFCKAQTGTSNTFLNDFLNTDKIRVQKRLSSKIVKSNISFEEVYETLKIGKEYSDDVKKGLVLWKYMIDSLEHNTSLFIPNSYSPDKKYNVHFRLHGGVSDFYIYRNHDRLKNSGYNCDSIRSIFIFPAAWMLRPWWHEGQYKNIRYLLSRLKTTYNIDENNIHFSGASDGATGLFYQTNLNKTHWATLKPYIGSLGSAVLLSKIPLYVDNYQNSKILMYNTELDEIFDIKEVMLYINILKKHNVSVNHHIIKDVGHNLQWYSKQRDSIIKFVKQNHRNPFPNKISWQTDNPKKYGRCFWLNIEKIYKNQNPILTGYFEVVGKYKNIVKVEARSSGKATISRKGNRIDITTKEIKQLSLLLSPDQFDFKKTFEIYTNGKLYFEGNLKPDLKTLLKWYLIDKDRTMLYAHELKINPK